MGSEAITQNDLKNVLDAVLPVKPSEYRKLLWTNPSPTSAFSAQTVALDLSSYDDVEIEMVGDTTNANTTQNFKLTVGVGSLLDISANNIWWRYVTPKTTGVEFGAGYKTTTYGSGATLTNTQMVPLKIYGIKYERVAPPQVEYYTPKEFETAWNGHSAGYYTANCVQIGDLKIQWGILQAQSGAFHSVYFKVPFEGLGYFASASYTSNADVSLGSINPLAYITGQHTDYCRIRTGGGVYCWVCIGY